MSIDSQNSKARKTVLIIEDNDLIREIITELLKDEFEVLEACNGEIGYQVLENAFGHISLVLLDIHMPVCDGLQFMRMIKDDANLSSVPIVVMTTDVDETTEQNCLELGAIDFLPKTTNPTLLKIRIRNIIRIYENASYINHIEIDELTGIYNRAAFLYHAKKLIENNPDTSYDLSISDIHNFKLISGLHGEKKSAEILKYLAAFGTKYIGDGIWARYDLDQFAAIYPSEQDSDFEKSETGLGYIAEFRKNSPMRGIVINKGVYRNVDRTLSIERMCQRALLALDSIKGHPQKRTAFFDGPMSQQQIRFFNYERWFPEAIKKKEFVIWYQPKVNPRTGKIVGAEALVRWQRKGELIKPPCEFLDVFEKNGQIVELDGYVFHRVCEYQAKRISEGKILIPISVNLSRNSMLEEDLAGRYYRLALEYGVDPTYIPIEITETSTVANQQIKPLAEELRKFGFPLQMDDFGSGESSMTELIMMEFDAIKFDKTLIENIGNPRSEATLSILLEMIKKLGTKIVAEGVENAEQHTFMLNHSCDEIQGFYYSKPLPVEEFERYIAEHL